MWFLKILRMLFITIDTVVFHCVSLVYQLFMLLAETGIFKTEDIRNFADRMYFFLGLIMIFKVSTSIIQFIMNPDATKDSKIGAPKLLKNIVIILVGIVMIPYIFEAAFSLQRIVLQDNVIGSLILGMNYSSTGEAEDMVKDAGKRMEFDTFKAFFHFDTNYVSDACATNPYDVVGGTATVSQECKNDPNFDVINSFFESSAGNLYKRAYENNSVGLITDDVIYNYTVKDSDGKDQFLFSYLMIITTIAGGFLVYILILFCFDVAVRSVKLGFLQLIAPIPLISKIDPKKGDEVFNNWVKECVSTYLSLFLRLVSIYFAIFIISLIGDGMFNVIDEERVSNPFVFVFIMFGTLLFVKELPKLIETITGLKLAGNGLSLKKKLGSVPLIGGAANKAAGLAGRTGLNLAKGVGRLAGAGLSNTVGKKLSKSLGKVGGKAKKAFNDSALGNWHAQRVLDGVDMGSKLRNARDLAARGGRFLNKHSDGAFSDIGKDASATFSGLGASVLDGVGALESRKTRILNSQSEAKARAERNKTMAAAHDEVVERAKKKVRESEAYVKANREIEKMKKELEIKMQDVENRRNEKDENGNLKFSEQEIAYLENDIHDLNNNIVSAETTFAKKANKEWVNDYIDGNFEGSASDTTLAALKDKRDSTASALGFESSSFASAAGADKFTGELKEDNARIQGSFVEGNTEIAKIDEQIRKAKEFKSNK